MASKYLKKYGVRLDPDPEVMTCLGSKEGFSHMCLALMGPGDTAIVPAPYFPVHMYAVALAAGNVIALEVADSDKFLENIAYTCQHLVPTTQIADPLLSAQSVDRDGRTGILCRSRQPGEALWLHGHQRFCLRRRGLRWLPSTQLSGGTGGHRRGRRVHDDEQGLQYGRLASRFLRGNAEMIEALGVIKGYYDYGMFQAIQIAAIVALRTRDAAVEQQSEIYRRRRDALVDGLTRIGWNVPVPKAGMFVWTPIPDHWQQRMSTMDFAMMLLEKGDVAVSPGSGFGESGEGYLRMSLVENENRLRQAVRQIARCLEREEKSVST